MLDAVFVYRIRSFLRSLPILVYWLYGTSQLINCEYYEPLCCFRERESVTKTISSFTLIELLIVVAIIGILAALIIVSVTSAAAKARDIKRQEDLRNIQKALEMYYTSNGSYPSTGGAWQGASCNNSSSNHFGTNMTISGSNGYVPNVAPTYIPILPLDPRSGTIACGGDLYGGCYLYKSDGINYKILAYEDVETTTPTQTNALQDFWDPGGSGGRGCTYALYTPGAANW